MIAWRSLVQKPGMISLCFLCLMLQSGCGADALGLKSAAVEGLKVRSRDGNIFAVQVLSSLALETVLKNGRELSPPCQLSIDEVPLSLQEVRGIAGLKVSDLQFYKCGLQDAFAPEICKANSVRSLSIRYEEGFTDEGLSMLADLKDLRTLNLSGCPKISGRGFSRWPEHPSMLELSLNLSGIDDEGLAHLDCFPNLKKISLGGTKISPDGLMHLASLRYLLNPGFPDDITPDMRSRLELMKRYNAKFKSLHGDDATAPYAIFELD